MPLKLWKVKLVCYTNDSNEGNITEILQLDCEILEFWFRHFVEHFKCMHQCNKINSKNSSVPCILQIRI